MRLFSRWFAVLPAALPMTSGAVTDPNQEPLAAEVEVSVKVLTNWWEGKAEIAAVMDVLAAEVESGVVWPDRLEKKTLPGGLESRFWTGGGAEAAEVATGPQAVAARLALPGATASRTEAKFILVREEDGVIRTELLLGVYRLGSEARQETRARWRSEWVRRAGKILLRRNELMDYSELVLAGGAPLLHDRTTAVLPKDGGLDPELTRDNFYWRHRIEAALQPDPFGHNGISVADLNGDGRPDVFLAQMGGLRNRVFLQQGDGTCLDGSAQSGLDFLDNTTGALFVDFDNDGDQDAAVAAACGLLICENNGSGQFEVRQRYEELTYVFGLAAADYDRDGDLDFYVCQYYGADGADEGEQQRGSIPVPFPIYDANNGGRNVLFRNEGGLTFMDVTAAVGLDERNRRYSFASLWEDWDRDGDPDLVVVNDFGRIASYENRDGVFVEDSAARGFAMSSFGMGVAAADFNRDGWLDLHVSNMFSGAGSRITRQPDFRGQKGEPRTEEFQSMAAGNALYLSEAGKRFRESGRESGVAMGRWSWGCVAPDLNNDGWEDLLVANGFVTGTELDDL